MIKQGEAQGDVTMIRFGPLTRRNPTAKYIIYHWVVEQQEDGTPTAPVVDTFKKGAVPDKGRLSLTLPHGERYLIVLQDGTHRCLETTASLSLIAPFYVTIDANPPKPQPVSGPQVNAVSRGVHNALRRR